MHRELLDTYETAENGRHVMTSEEGGMISRTGFGNVTDDEQDSQVITAAPQFSNNDMMLHGVSIHASSQGISESNDGLDNSLRTAYESIPPNSQNNLQLQWNDGSASQAIKLEMNKMSNDSQIIGNTLSMNQ